MSSHATTPPHWCRQPFRACNQKELNTSESWNGNLTACSRRPLSSGRYATPKSKLACCLRRRCLDVDDNDDVGIRFAVVVTISALPTPPSSLEHLLSQLLRTIAGRLSKTKTFTLSAFQRVSSQECFCYRVLGFLTLVCHVALAMLSFDSQVVLERIILHLLALFFGYRVCLLISSRLETTLNACRDVSFATCQQMWTSTALKIQQGRDMYITCRISTICMIPQRS